MLTEGKPASEAMQTLGIEQVDDSAAKVLCQELLARFPQIVEDVKAGKQQAVGRLIGEAKKQNPNINPGQFRQLCLDTIGEM